MGDGFVEGLAQGEFEIIATLAVAAGSGVAPMSVSVPVVVEWPAVDALEVAAHHEALFVGTTIQHDVHARHPDGSHRPDPAVEWVSSDPSMRTR